MKKNLLLPILLFCSLTILISQEKRLPPSQTGGKIETAYKSGTLSHDEYVLNLLYSLKDNSKVDARFKDATPGIVKCGTSTVLKIREEAKSASPFVQKTVTEVLDRPATQKVYDTPGGHYRIHYDTTGSQSVYQPTVDTNPQNGVPDYVDRTAEIADRVWSFEIDTLGYDPPAPDGSAGGGTNRYDLYLVHESGAYGVTFTETFVPGYLGHGGFTSYIHVDPNYDGFGYPDRTLPMKVTIAHEFFHAIQFVYNASAGSWFLEISSTWMEDIAYNSINDYYLYLNVSDGIFRAPHLSLETANGSHEYSSAIFDRYISENFGVAAIKTIWQKTIGNHAAEIALDSGLATYGSSFADVYGGFCVWNYFTGNRGSTQHPHYSEATSYPQTTIIRRITGIPFDSTSENLVSLGNYATYYIKIVGSHQTGDFHLDFNDPNAYIWRTKFITDSARNYRDASFDISDGAGTGVIPVWQHVDSVIFIPASTNPTGGGGALFGYSGSIVPSSGVTEQSGIPRQFELKQNFPNPFNPATTIHYRVPQESFVSLKIYDMLGKEIAQLVNERKQAGEYSLRWEPTGATSGLYFYTLKSGTFSTTKKMLLLK